MKFLNFITGLILYTFIFLGISNSSYSKVLDFNQDAKNISNYFSGIISFDDFDYLNSKKFLNSLRESGKISKNFSSKYIQSLIGLEKYKEAYSYSRKLEKENLSNFESNLVQGLFEFKNKNYDKAKFYFDRLKPNFEHQLTFRPLQISLKNWSDIAASNNKESIDLINSMPSEYGSFKHVQAAFAHCYFDTSSTEKEFNKIIKNEQTKFYRYNFFFANYLVRKGKHKEAENIVSLTSKKFPRNLLINQFGETLKTKEKNKNKFTCREAHNILGEIFYAFANALSTQQHYKISNFYIGLSKYLNPNFLSYDGLLADNFFRLKKYDESKKIYKNLSTLGSYYKWNSSKEIAFILDLQGKKKESKNFLLKVYNNINQNLYRTFDLANFLRDDDSYDQSISRMKVDTDLPSIMLPIPQDLSNTLAAGWQGKAFTGLGRAAVAAMAGGEISAMATKIKDYTGNLKAIQESLTSSVLNLVPGVGGNLDVNDISGATRGVVLNPNAELLYDSPELREIGMSFKMVPRNDTEAKIIRDICKIFRKASLPTWGANDDGELVKGLQTFKQDDNQTVNDIKDAKQFMGENFIRVPRLCKFTFMKGNKTHKYLTQFKPCAMSSVVVNFTPDNTYATYHDGSPVATELRINFQETKLIFAHDVKMNGESF